MAGKSGIKELEINYPQFKQYYIKSFDDMLEHWKEKGQPRRWKTGLEVYNWWVDNEKHDLSDGYDYYRIEV